MNAHHSNSKLIVRLSYQNKRYSMAFAHPHACQTWIMAMMAEFTTHKSHHVSLSNFQQQITLKDIFQRFINEKLQSNVKKQDRNRIQKFLRDNPKLVNKALPQITKADMRTWLKKRAKEVSGSSVRKEISHINMVFKVANNEWDLPVMNPLDGIEKPSIRPPRERLIQEWEIEQFMTVVGYSKEKELSSIKLRTGAAFSFSLETGLRAGEICKLKWEDIYDSGKVLKVKTAKTRSGVREVPLSKKAREIVEQCRRGNNTDFVFRITSSQLDSNFRKYRHMAGLKGFTFHDARATAITKLAKKLHVLDLARIIGHKNVQTLMIYYREKAETLADQLD